MGADPDTKIWVSVLGPLEARSDAGSIPLTSGNQRRLLASLLLARGRVVSLGHLADDIWGMTFRGIRGRRCTPRWPGCAAPSAPEPRR